MPAQELRYLSFLLRCWQEQGQTPNHSTIWRFSLEDIDRGERRGFSDLEALVNFLHEHIAPDAGSEDG